MPTRVRFNLPPVQSMGTVLAVALLVVSLLTRVSPLENLALWPDRVLGQLYLWQPLTYALSGGSPGGVLFGALILWMLGGFLEGRWGQRRFLLFCAGVVGGAGVLTVLLALALPSLVGTVYHGGPALSGSVWVAYGLLVGRSQTNFWGLPVTGNVLALIGAGFVFLNAAFYGLSPFLPDFLALGLTWLVVRGALPGRLWTRLRSWQLERDLKRRSSHLRPVEGGRREPPRRDRDQYLN